jgi:hypothetical protein
MIVNAFIIFQEFKKENPLKFDNLPVHFSFSFTQALTLAPSVLCHLVKQSLSDEKQRLTLQFPQWINVLQCVSGSSFNLA